MSTPAQAPFFVDQEIIQLTQNGIWLADGGEITHHPTRRLFSKSLKKDDRGYFLHIGNETKRIEVEDTAYFVLRIDGNARDGFTLLLNDETQENLEPQSLQYRPGRLTCRIKAAREEAKFLHSSYFDLLKNLQEDTTSYFLEIEGEEGKKLKIELALK